MKLIIFAFSIGLFRTVQSERTALVCDQHTELNDGARILGPTAKKGSWPWIVHLTHYSDHKCQGTYLGNGWVISVKHCIETFHGKNRYGHRQDAQNHHISTYFGQYVWDYNYGQVFNNAYDNNTESFNMKPIQRFSHPTANLILLKYDVKIINDNIAKGGGASYVREACIPNIQLAQNSNLECYVAGWGIAKHEGYEDSKTLREARVHILNDDYCLKYSGYEATKKLPKKPDHAHFNWKVRFPAEFCAGNLDTDQNGKTDEGEGACRRDSGGPLICDVANRPILAGIVSWGRTITCEKENYPGIYVSIAQYSQWIHSTTNNDVQIVSLESITSNMIIFGESVIGYLGEAISPGSLISALSKNMEKHLKDLQPDWNPKKSGPHKRITKMLKKVFPICPKKSTCVAYGDDSMMMPGSLNSLGQIRFFITEVLPAVQKQWYKNIDETLKVQGNAAMKKVTKYADKIFDFSV